MSLEFTSAPNFFKHVVAMSYPKTASANHRMYFEHFGVRNFCALAGGVKSLLQRAANRELVRLALRFRGAMFAVLHSPKYIKCRPLISVILSLLVVTGLAGCGRKVVSTKMPFEIDKVFDGSGRTVVTEETNKERGIRLAKSHEYNEAIEAFKKHVEAAPQDFFGFNAIAVCYKNMGDQANAMKNFERALEFVDSPEERAKVLANIGNLYFSANKPQGALGFYKEAAAEFDRNPLYLILIARTFVVLGDQDRARKVLAAVDENYADLEKFERDDERGLGAYLTAYCYAGLNEEDKVFKYLENALKANPQRYVPKIENEIQDQKSLFYTLQGDPRLLTLINRYKGA